MSSSSNSEAVAMPNSLSITFNEGDIESIQADGKLIPTATSRGSTDEQAAATRESTGLVDDNTNDEEQPAAVKAKEKSKGMSGRPINATDISVEDQIIIRMKRERRSDKEIADHLRTECNCHYVPKTIGTRWARLRAKIAVLKDKQLETGEVNWTTKEDSTLISAVIKAKSAMAKLVAETEAKMWNIAVKELHAADRELVYSTRACRERYQSLVGGNVSWYPELSGSELRQAAAHTEANLLRFKREFREADLEADEEVKLVITLHQDDEHSSPASANVPAITTATPAVNDNDTVVGNEMFGLPLWMSRASRQDTAIAVATARLEAIELPPVQAMSRKELVAELSTRGFQSGGTVDQLRAITRKARQGKTDMPKSTVPLMAIEAFQKILRQTKVWEIDSDVEDEAKGPDDSAEKRGGRVKVISKDIIKNGKRKVSAEQSIAPGESLLAAIQQAEGPPTKKSRLAATSIDPLLQSIQEVTSQAPMVPMASTPSLASLALSHLGLVDATPSQKIHHQDTPADQDASQESDSDHGDDLEDSFPNFEEEDLL